MNALNTERLIDEARSARESAYAPYSHFPVGAALLCSDGSVFRGCNVENISFGLTICAERSAVVAAVTQGHRDFQAIAIVADTDVPISPCGACRQFLAEFSPRLTVISSNLAGVQQKWTLDVLLPRAKTGILNEPESST